MARRLRNQAKMRSWAGAQKFKLRRGYPWADDLKQHKTIRIPSVCAVHSKVNLTIGQTSVRYICILKDAQLAYAPVIASALE